MKIENLWSTPRRRNRTLVASSLGVFGLGIAIGNCNGSTVFVAPVPTAVAPAHPETHPTTPTTVPKATANLAPPLAPTGGDYDLASLAAGDAIKGNIPQAAGEEAQIQDPTIKAKAEHAIELAEGYQATTDALAQDTDQALSLLGAITMPDVSVQAHTSIMNGVATTAVYYAKGLTYSTAQTLEQNLTDPTLVNDIQTTITDMENGDQTDPQTIYDQLHQTSVNEANILYAQAEAEWQTLYHHTTPYVQQYDLAKQ